MKILLVTPSQLDEHGRPMRYRQANLPPLALAIIAALTPERHTVRVVNDMVEDIDYEGDYDLVGITALTAQAPRGYQIADRFRARGVKVIFGGIHASTVPEEALEHADAIVTGEVETVWEQVIADLENGRLETVYGPGGYPSLDRLIIPRWDGFNFGIYRKSIGPKRMPRLPIFTTRGCLYACKYCTVTRFYGHRYRHKPIANVLAEIDATGADSFFFTDDNITCDPDYSRELFAAIKDRGIRWMSQASVQMLEHPDLIEAAGKAGCKSLYLGVESLDKEALRSMRKGFNRPERYPELFERLERAGIRPFVGMILGLDQDTPETLHETLDFLLRNRVQNVFLNIFTPLPGTEVYDEMAAAGRIIDRDWSNYDVGHVVFQPANFTPEQLRQTYWRMYERIYSRSAIAGRLLADLTSLRKGPGKIFRDTILQIYMRKHVRYGENPLSMGIGRIPYSESRP